MKPMQRREFLKTSATGVSVLTLASALGKHNIAAAASRSKNQFHLTLRKRVSQASDPNHFQSIEEKAIWDPQKTAVTICDMWDSHHCKNAADRVVEMAPRLNEFVEIARSKGALIIHAPSSCMGPYEGTPARIRAQRNPLANTLPDGIGQWCHSIPAEERGVYPLDQSDGGCDTEIIEQEKFAAWLTAQGRNPNSPWQRQIETIRIDQSKDAISDQGKEIWNLLEVRDIQNVMLVGVHTNMCVLGRPFGLRQMAKNGKNTVLVRDLTDTMYNPKMWPYVDHFTGTDLIVEHIEKYVCPSILSSSLTNKAPFRFQRDVRTLASGRAGAQKS